MFEQKSSKGLMAEVTSIRFAAQLQDVKSRQGTRNAKIQLMSNLSIYRDLCMTSQTVRNDLPIEQQYRLTKRIIAGRKSKEIWIIAEGRGRKLKSSHFSELAEVMEYAFGESDTGNGGVGLEAHPRLTTDTLYRAKDNAITMKEARDNTLSLALKGFSISLSSCYNYTENYRHGSIQSKRHHQGKGVNARISSRKPL